VGFNVQDPSLVELYWDQGSYEDGFRFRLGKLDPSLFLDGGRYVSANAAFLNAAFSDTPAMPLPAAGLGLAAVLYPAENVYILGSLQDRKGDRTGTGIESVRDGELFYALEVGLTPAWGEPGEGLYHVTGWYADASSTPDLPSAGGVALTLEQELGDEGNVVPFLRYSWASAATPVEHLLAVGVGLEDVFGQNFDLIGLGLSWGRPRDGSRRDQYALETFYRFHLTEHTHLTPDIQLIVNPSNAPDPSTVWVFGLRLRTLF
jgi:porin